jgi:hypothetical protein
MKLRLTILLIAIPLLCFCILPLSGVSAESEKEVKADVAVAAMVPTKACAQYSSITSNVSEILSDATQKATLTVLVKNCAEVAVENALVTITSNRGAIDKIRNVDENGVLVTSGDGVGIAAYTDVNGYAFFEAYSSIPGEALFTANVDNQLNIGQVKITFLPLPFPKSIVVVAEVPRILSPSGFITIFKPKDMDVNKDNLVNMTMELRVPVWVFYLTTFLMIAIFVMFLSILILSLRIHKLQGVEIAHIEEEEKILKKEEKEIEKIANSEDAR